MLSGYEVIQDRFVDELVDQERIEAPIDGVPLEEGVVHRYEHRVLFIYQYRPHSIIIPDRTNQLSITY